ncbi:MAG: tripartite tricarboxylate transporter TctB family protein [Alcanivorax sp.]|nr:tripartite tricarboxylate transporter TctB family protein [Alcanivorax sp.]
MPERSRRALVTSLFGLFGLLLVLLAMPFTLSGQQADAPDDVSDAGNFPAQPVRIIVYTSPGGLIDFTARRFADIARKYSDQPFVVINRPGGGGIVAFEEALQRPADGYTMLAVTRSNISKMVATGRDGLIDQLDWHSYVMDNPHVLISNRDSGLTSWQALYREAVEKAGGQLWLGADIGGVKHVSGVKMARQAGIEMRWIPYGSGGEAVAALLGQLGSTYLGNPRDAMSSDDLQIIAVASDKRMAQFPDAPTFEELGVPGLKDENIWRGFAFRQGMPEARRAWFTDLMEKVTSDPDWIESWEGEGVNLQYKASDEFQKIVARDREEFSYYLKEIGLLRERGSRQSLLEGIGDAPARQFFTGTIIVLNLLLAVILAHSSFRQRTGELMVLSAVASLAVLFFVLSASLPPPSPIDTIGARGVPRLWIYLLLPLAIYQVFLVLRHREAAGDRERPYQLFRFIGIVTCYILLVPWLGYLLASAIYMPAALWFFDYRKPLRIAILTAGWLLFSWLVFQRVLYVDLPIGRLFG